MSRQIRLYPGSDPNLFSLTPWIDIVHDEDNASELWIDTTLCLYNNNNIDLNHSCFKNIKEVYFYDFFHTHCHLAPVTLNLIKTLSKKYPTVYYTCSKLPIADITTVHFDYPWNKSKYLYLEQQPTWKSGPAEPYKQYPIHYRQRTHHFLNLTRLLYGYREQLVNFLSQYNGFVSNVSKGIILTNQYVDPKEMTYECGGFTTPPDRYYFDNSYISCQQESQYELIDCNYSVTFTEKTYEHLFQGRLVLNFGPPNFYQVLEQEGWKLPVGIDLSWDVIANNDQRFSAYLAMLESLFKLSINDLHDLFLLNQSTIEHNFNMLHTKDYYYIKGLVNC